MNLIKIFICKIKGHKFVKYRAPVDYKLSWSGWIELSGIRCNNGCGRGRKRKGSKC